MPSLLTGIDRGPLLSRADSVGTALVTAPSGPVIVHERRDSALSNPMTLLGTSADKTTATRPNPYVCPLYLEELRALFANSGPVRRIVSLPGEMAIRKGWSSPELDREYRRLWVFPKVAQAMAMARLYGNALVVPITEDDVPPGFRGENRRTWLEQPLDVRRVGQVYSLQVFDAIEVRPVAWNTDLRSPGYRLPMIWQLTQEGAPRYIHASRCALFRGTTSPPSELRGAGWYNSTGMPDASVIQHLWDDIRRMSDTRAGGAVLAAEFRKKVLKLGSLEQLATGNEGEAMFAQLAVMQQMDSTLGMTVIGPNDTYTSESTNVTGYKDLTDAMVTALVESLGWTRTMWSGDTPGGLGDSDKGSLERERQYTSAYQEANREPLELIDRILYSAADGPTKGKIPEDGWLQFASLDEPDAKAVAETRKIYAETDAIEIGAGIISPRDVAISRHGPDGWKAELDPVEPPDEDAELELAVEAARMEAERLAAEEGAASEVDEELEDNVVSLRGDAEPLLPPDAPAELRAAVAKLIAEWSPEVKP